MRFNNPGIYATLQVFNAEKVPKGDRKQWQQAKLIIIRHMDILLKI